MVTSTDSGLRGVRDGSKPLLRVRCDIGLAAGPGFPPVKNAVILCQNDFFAGARDGALWWRGRLSPLLREPPRERRPFLPDDWNVMLILRFHPIVIWAERIVGCTVRGARTKEHSLVSNLRRRWRLRLMTPGIISKAMALRISQPTNQQRCEVTHPSLIKTESS